MEEKIGTREMLEKYKLIGLFVILTASGLFVYYWDSKALWEFYNVLGVSTTIALSVIAFIGYVEYMRGEDSIKIYFETDGQQKPTGLSLLRKDCIRSEIFGLLRMLLKEDIAIFTVKDFNKNTDILRVIADIKTGKEMKLIIKATTKELEQFNLPA